jgi:hypothetical protein
MRMNACQVSTKSDQLHFLSEVFAGADQLRRLRRAITRAPDIVQEKFGKNASWKNVVCCVLSGLPWSAGRVDDVFYYDMSALTRFFDEGTIYVKANP